MNCTLCIYWELPNGYGPNCKTPRPTRASHAHVCKRTLKPDTIVYEVFRFGDETLYAAHRRIVGLREPEDIA
jgi:hypothetical protein